MKIKELENEIAGHQWWHCIELGNGVTTPGSCAHGQSEEELNDRWAIPADLRGKTVLDIGCMDGLFSVACLRRGATHALGMDIAFRPTFRIVANALGYAPDVLAQVSPDQQLMPFRQMDAQDEMNFVRNSFDLVLCFGVIYHVERPLEVIRNAVRAAKERVIIETALAAQVEGPWPDDDRNPSRWIQARGHAEDPTNVWYPTAAAVLDAMTTFGCYAVSTYYTLPDGSRATFVGAK